MFLSITLVIVVKMQSVDKDYLDPGKALTDLFGYNVILITLVFLSTPGSPYCGFVLDFEFTAISLRWLVGAYWFGWFYILMSPCDRVTGRTTDFADTRERCILVTLVLMVVYCMTLSHTLSDACQVLSMLLSIPLVHLGKEWQDKNK
jgi:hypothetical protein